MSGAAPKTATFSPELPPIESPPRGELLGKFVPSAIARVPPSARLQGAIRLGLTGLLTAGYLPFLQLRSRFDDVLSLERQQLELAGELLDQHLPPDDRQPVHAAAARVVPALLIKRIAELCYLGSLGCAFAWLARHDWTLAALKQLYFVPPQMDQPLWMMSFVLLALSYILLHVQVNRHIANLQQYALALNAVLESRAPRVNPPALVWGLRVTFLAVGALMLVFGLLWALPLMLAWGAFGSFIARSDRRFRSELSHALSAVSGIAPVVEAAELCHNRECRHPLPEAARYCPRCGRAVTLE